MTKHELAEWLHDNYEELAKAENWQTQEITRVKFEDLPTENKSTMLALADRMLNTFNFITSNTVLCEVKPTWVENKKCTQCGSENIKWHLSSTKECKDCKSIFRADELV